MTCKQLADSIRARQSFLCVGLDTDPVRLPAHLGKTADSVVAFNHAIIDATKDSCVAYKINTAFYEAMGAAGWEAMEATLAHIPDTHLKIADAKRGDIGNTSAQYARAFFETLKFDAITVSPYMGEDSLRPFLEHRDKFTIVLGLTSNAGAADFEMQPVEGERLYEKVLRVVSRWGTPDNLMFVAGATRPETFQDIRAIIPDHFLLVPGIGEQGGSLESVARAGLNDNVGLLVNASRAIIFASAGEDFADRAQCVAEAYRQEMGRYLSSFSVS